MIIGSTSNSARFGTWQLSVIHWTITGGRYHNSTAGAAKYHQKKKTKHTDLQLQVSTFLRQRSFLQLQKL